MPGEPVLPSGVLVLDVKSDQFWVYEVWARTNYGWVQLQPGPGRGAFRNSLIAGVRLSQYRLWLARVGEESDERPLREAAGLLVPAALLLTRARTATSPPAQGRAPGSTPPHELRIRAGAWTSPVGVAPAVGDTLRLAATTCQHFETGYYAAHRDIAEWAPDLVVFLGDFIYEGGVTTGRRRPRAQPSRRRAARRSTPTATATPSTSATPISRRHGRWRRGW